MNYYNEIKQELVNNEIYKRVKEYSKRLTKELGKGYNTTTLKRMRQFFILIQKGAPMGHQLSWSHYRTLLVIKDINAVNYYIQRTIKNNLTKRELEVIIKNKEYERLDDSIKEKLSNAQNTSLVENVKNPLIIYNKNNYEEISEKILQKIILEDIETFMKELGNSFCFIGSEYKIKIGNNYNYIDLLLYNIEYNCYVVVELKVTELKKEHIGQIEIYMNYIDRNIKKINQNKTIGIIICKKDNKYIIEYCSDKRIISREYLLI